MSKFGSTSVTVTTPLQAIVAIVDGREIASSSASTGLHPSLASYGLGPLQVIEERSEPNTADTSLDTSLDTIDVSLLSNPFGEDEVVSGGAGGTGVKEQQEQQEQQEEEEEHEEHEADVTGATFGDTTLDSVYSQESRASSVYRRSEVLLRGVLGRGDGLRPPASPATAFSDTVTPTPAGETELVGPEPASGVETALTRSGVAVGGRGREGDEQTGMGEGKGELQGEKKGEAGKSKAQAAEAGEQQRDVSPLQPLAKREDVEDVPGCSCERWPCSAQ